MTAHWKKEMHRKLEAELRRSLAAEEAEEEKRERGDWPDKQPRGILFLYGVPYLTLCLMALFIFVYWAEHVPGYGYSVTFGNKLPPLYAAGAISRDTVLAGEWWRIFTAPLLHTGFAAIVSSVLYTFIAGSLGEAFIGPAWLAALFVVSSIGGSVGCLVLNPHADLTAGVGAPAGMLAGSLTYFFTRPAMQLRRHSQRATLWLVIPALLPMVIPILNGASLHLSLGALVGGGLAGSLMGFVLCEIASDKHYRPERTEVGLAIAAAGAVCFAVSFWIIV